MFTKKRRKASFFSTKFYLDFYIPKARPFVNRFFSFPLFIKNGEQPGGVWNIKIPLLQKISTIKQENCIKNRNIYLLIKIRKINLSIFM